MDHNPVKFFLFQMIAGLFGGLALGNLPLFVMGLFPISTTTYSPYIDAIGFLTL